MDWLGLQLTSMFLFVLMCFSACVVPALFAHRLRQGGVCSEVITYLNCVSGGVFAATFFIMYNHINNEFAILLAGAPVWHERFVLGAFIVFLGFLLTGLIEKLTAYFQRKETSKNSTFSASAVGVARNNAHDTSKAAINQRHSRDVGSGARLIAEDAEELSPLNSAAPDETAVATNLRDDDGVMVKHHALVHHSENGYHDHANERSDAGKNYISMERIQPTDPGNVAGSTSDLLAEEDSADTPNFNFHQHSSVVAAAPQHDHHHHHGHQHGDHHHHLPGDFGGTSSMKRFIIILAALSAHSVFEGMALGVQTNRNLFVKLFVSILLHEVLMAMAIGLSLGEQRIKLRRKVLFAFVFSTIIPIGQVIGILMQKSTTSLSDAAVASNVQVNSAHHHRSSTMDSLNATDNDAVSTTSAVVQALAVGTFLYVTFFEILPERMHRSDFSLIHVGFTIIGFLLIPVASVLQFRRS